MIYNGFDPGTMAYLAGEERLAGAQADAPPPGRLERMILLGVASAVLLVSVILLAANAA